MELIDAVIGDLIDQSFSIKKNVIAPAELHEMQNAFESDFVAAQVGKGDKRQRNENIRGDWTRWLNPMESDSRFSKITSILNELKTQVNQKLFLGIKEYECHLAKYPSGTFYSKHSDRFESDSSRSLTFIFYLHEKWSEADGGELIIYDNNNNILKVIYPEPGSMVCFLPSEFPHEVKICHKERRSLTGWMHTKIIY